MWDVTPEALAFALAWAETTATGRGFALDWSSDWVRATRPDYSLLATLRNAAVAEPSGAARYRRWVASLPGNARARTPPFGPARWPLPAWPGDDPAWARQQAESQARW